MTNGMSTAETKKKKAGKKNPTEFCVIRLLIFSGIDEIRCFELLLWV